MQELAELQRQGMSIQGISKLTGWDRKTARKYLLQPKGHAGIRASAKASQQA